ncbi:YadA-like family protein [Burkholderia cenocepacia]|uniref:YadA-like family protein n=1 Tax=Burkholderia cepacia complex TaxID=87882 RepID=UPI003D80AC71
MNTALSTKADNTYFKVNSTEAAAQAGTANSVAIGPNAVVNTGGVTGANSSIAIGNGAVAGGTDSIMIGTNARHSGSGATVLGGNASAMGGGLGVALGYGSSASGSGGMALGSSTTAGGRNSVALGTDSIADAENTVSVGSASLQRRITNMAAGTGATDAVNVSQLSGVTNALGGNARVGTDGSIVQPTYTVAGTDYHNVGDALDALAANGGTDPNAVRYDDATKGTVTLGGAGATMPVALKNVADAKDDHDALNLGQLKNAGLVGDDGAGHLTSLAVTYDDATKNAVTLGNVGASVTIRNVADGVLSAASTDAVNGSQLFATNTRVGNLEDSLKDGGVIDPVTGESLAVVYDGTAKDKVTLAGTDGTTLSNVQAGVADMDAVNVGQMNTALSTKLDNKLVKVDGDVAASTVGEHSIAIGSGASADNRNDPVGIGIGSIAVGDQAQADGANAVAVGARAYANTIGSAFGTSASASGAGASAIGYGTDASGRFASAIGSLASASGENSVALGANSVADRDNTVSVGFATQQRQIVNVAAGTQDTDAVNVGQLKDSGLIGDDGKSIAAVTYDRLADGTPNYGSVTLGNGAGPTQLKNVADATDDHDALNLGQLKDAGLVGDDGSGNLTSLAVTYDGATKDKVTLAGTDGTTLSNVKAGVADMDAVNVSQLKGSGLIGDDGKSIAAVTYDRHVDGTPNYGAVTLGNGTGPTQLKNVADATDDHDALNLGQLKDTGLIGDDGSGNLTSLAVTYDDATKQAVTLGNAGTPVALHNVAAGALSETSTDAVNGSQLFATNTRVGNLEDSLKDGGVIDPVTGESLAVVYDGTAKDTVTLKGTDGTTLSNVKAGVADMDAVNVSQLKDSGLIGDDGKAIAAVTYDRNTDGTPNYGTVTLGNGEGPTQIKNVAAGVDGTDAVNVNQMNTGLSDLEDRLKGADLRFVKVNADPVTGTPALATGALAVAIGSGAQAAGANSLALGSGARVSGSGSIAIGYNSIANQNNVVSVGSVGNERRIVNVGDGDVSFQSTDAINGGQLYAALNDLSTSVNSKTQQAIDSFSSAIDEKTKAAISEMNTQSMQPMDVTDPLVAVEGLRGDNLASLNGADPATATAVAIGTSSAASGANAVAIGVQNVAGSDNSVALGSFAATGAGQQYSVAMGSNVQTNGTQAVAMGANAQANADYALAIGNNNVQAIGDSSIALGNGANVRAGATNSIAMGTGANVARNVQGAMALGSGATATTNGGIALGDNALANRANALSIGRAGAERQIVNVAAGTQNTDAVNVGQLKGVTNALGGGAGVGADGSVTQPTYSVGGKDYNNVGDALGAIAASGGDPDAVKYDDGTHQAITLGNAGTPVAIHNVAEGALTATSTDAVNGSQLFATNQSIGDLRDSLRDGGVIDPVTGESLAVVYDGAAKDKVTLKGADGTTLANVKAGVADMDAVNVSQLKDAGLIGDDGKAIAAVTYDDATKTAVTLGNAGTPVAIHNVAAGALSETSTDAVNGSQLFATNTRVGDLADSLGRGGVIDPVTGESLAVVYDGTAKDTVTLKGADGTTLANVKAGVADRDAVNVSQLKGSGLIGDDGKSIAAVTYDRNTDGTPNYGSVTFGHGAGLTQLKNVAAATDDTDAVNFGQMKQYVADNPGEGGPGNPLAVAYDDASKGQVTLAGGADGTTITNVKAGEVSATSKDAINGAQLHGTAQSVADSLGGGATVGADGTVTNPTYSLADPTDGSTKTEYHNVGDALANLDGRTSTNTENITVINKQLSDSGLVDPATGQTLAAVTYDRNPDGTPNRGSVTLGGADATTPVALKNVADGTDRHDAINLGQLQDAGLVAPVDPADPGTGLKSLAVTYDGVAQDKVTLKGADGTTLANVKAGVADMDAVNVSQLKDAGLIGDGGKAIAAVTYDDATKGKVTLKGADGTTLANVKAGVADMDAVNVSQLKGSGLIGDDGKAIAAVTYDRLPDGTPDYGKVTLGNGEGPTQIKNVANATDDGDALNLGQLKEAGLVGDDGSGNLTSLAVTYDDAAKNAITLGGTGATTPVAIHNVADGVLSATSHDAVNGSQLFATNTRVGNLEDSLGKGGVIDPITGESLAVVYDGTAKDKVTLQGADGTTLANVKAGVADMDAVNVRQLKDSGLIGDDGKAIAAVTYDDATKSTVTLGGAGSTTPVTLKNVADGVDRHDAINLGQLQDAGLVAPVDPTNPGAGLTSTAVTYDKHADGSVNFDQITLKGGADGTKLSNVAAGEVSATSKDAINGAQLHGTAQSMADSLGGGSKVDADGKVTNPTYSLVDPADGSTKTEYHNVGDALANLDGRTATNTENITVINKQLGDSGLIDPATGQTLAAVTYDRNADGTPNRGSVTLGGADATTPVALKNVADGVDANDAVNLGQLQSAGIVAPVDPENPGKGLKSLAVVYDGVDQDTVTLKGTDGTTLTNVKAGVVSATSTDAINGSQLYGASQSVAKALGGGATVDANGNVTNPTYTVNNEKFDNVGDALENISSSLVHGSIGLVQQDETTRDITVAKDTDGTTVNFAGTAGDRVLTGVGAGVVSATSNDAINGSQLHGTAQSVADTIGGGTTVDANGKLADTSIEVNGSKYKTVAEAVQAAAAYGATDSLAVRYDLNRDGSPNYGSVTLGGTGAAPVRLGNVADGTTQYDAVNFGQLSELSDRLGDVDGRVGRLEQNPGNGTPPGGGSGGSDYFAGTDVGTGTTPASAGTGVGNTAAGSGAVVGTGVNNGTVVGSNANVSASNGTAIGTGSKSSAEGATAIGNNANASGSKSAAIGDGASASGSNSVALGAGSMATSDNTVSVGSATQQRTISNLADGVNATDAATKGQLDRAMGGMQGQMNELSRNAYSGIAAATALTMIPGVDPGKTLSFGIGGATFQGYQAVAFGGEARITQNLKMKAGVGLSSGGNTVGVGASYQW